MREYPIGKGHLMAGHVSKAMLAKSFRRVGSTPTSLNIMTIKMNTNRPNAKDVEHYEMGHRG